MPRPLAQATFGLMLLPSLAFAECHDPQTTHEMRHCAALEYDRADAKLNATYKAAQRSMRNLDENLPEHLKGASAALLQAQRAWIPFRDAACTAEGFQFRGGTFEPLMVLTCKTDLTHQRSAQLAQLIEPD